MKLLEKMRDIFMFGGEDFEEEENLNENEIEAKNNKAKKIIDFKVAKQTQQVIINCPGDIEEAALVVNYLKQGKICVINLKSVEKARAQRITDLLSGAVYYADGAIEKISSDIFIIAPANVNISGEFKKELSDNGLILPWASAN